jgi:hypothetical protein
VVANAVEDFKPGYAVGAAIGKNMLLKVITSKKTPIRSNKIKGSNFSSGKYMVPTPAKI